MLSERNDFNMKNFKMQTAACARCGKVFSYIGFGLRYCDICKKYDEKEFDLVRNYIYDNGTSTMAEIEENTGVSSRRITQYLREGRLEIPENSPIYIKCDSCHTDIRSGRYCRPCGTKLSKNLNGPMFQEIEIGEEPKNNFNGKMRFNREN